MGLVGFQQTYLKCYDKIDADLTSSLSGIFIDQSAHPLITLENITALAKDYLNSEILDYDATVTYNKNDIVVAADIVYYSLQDDNTNKTPVSEPTWWQASALVSFYLKRVMRGAAINLFNSTFTNKKLYESAKTLLADLSLYEGTGNLKNKVSKTGRFVAYKITPKQSDTVITISQIGFQADTVNDALPFYVYHDSQNDPIATFDLNVSKAVSFTWATLETALKLYFNSDDAGDGGNYYIGYYEEDLIGQAIWRETLFSGNGCASCGGINSTLYNRWRKFINVQPIYVDADFLDDDRNLFDVDHVVYIGNQNWGMNLRLTVQCDVSDFICRNKFVFTDAYKLQIVHDILNDMAYSVRDNQLKQKVQQMAMLALKGDKEDYYKGVNSELCDAIKAITFDMSDINHLCVSCKNYMGIEVSSVYS